MIGHSPTNEWRSPHTGIHVSLMLMSLYTLRKCFEAITTPNCYTICETSLKPLKKLPLKSCMFSLLNVSTFGGLYIYLSSLKKIIIRSYRYIFENTLKFKMEFFKLEKLFTQQTTHTIGTPLNSGIGESWSEFL